MSAETTPQSTGTPVETVLKMKVTYSPTRAKQRLIRSFACTVFLRFLKGWHVDMQVSTFDSIILCVSIQNIMQALVCIRWCIHLDLQLCTAPLFTPCCPLIKLLPDDIHWLTDCKYGYFIACLLSWQTEESASIILHNSLQIKWNKSYQCDNENNLHCLTGLR